MKISPNLKKIIAYVKPYKWSAILNITFNILQVIFGLFSLAMIVPLLPILFEKAPAIMAKPEFHLTIKSALDNFNYFLINIIQEHGKIQALLMICIFVLTMIFLKNFFLFFANYFMTPLRNGVVKDIRNKIYAKILQLPLSYYSDEKKGDIISRMTNDVKEIEVSVMSSLEMVFRDPFTIVFYFFTLLYMSPELTLFILFLLPISGGIIGFIGKSLRKESKAAQEQMGSLISSLEETLTGLKIIKAFNGEYKANQRFTNINNVYTKKMNRMYRKNFLASPLSEFLGISIVLVILYYGGRLVINEKSTLSPQEFIGYIIIFSQIITPAKSFATAFYNIQKGLACIDRVNIILHAQNNIIEKENARTLTSFNHSIELKEVCFKYDKTEVLKNINLKIEKGKTIALVGQSGSGKSTLVDMLPRFYDIEQGDILIDDISIKDLKISNLRNLMGYVNQEPILFNDTVFNNIAFGVANAKEEDVIAAAKVANAHEFIIEMNDGYQTNIGDKGNKMSGGQRQRLSIARAVLKNPPIMILDEATSALDTESERLVQDALTKLMKSRTSVVIAHRLSTIKNADEICVMQEGEIVERGSHDALYEKNGVYRKLCDLQLF